MTSRIRAGSGPGFQKVCSMPRGFQTYEPAAASISWSTSWAQIVPLERRTTRPRFGECEGPRSLPARRGIDHSETSAGLLTAHLELNPEPTQIDQGATARSYVRLRTVHWCTVLLSCPRALTAPPLAGAVRRRPISTLGHLFPVTQGDAIVEATGWFERQEVRHGVRGCARHH